MKLVMNHHTHVLCHTASRKDYFDIERSAYVIVQSNTAVKIIKILLSPILWWLANSSDFSPDFLGVHLHHHCRMRNLSTPVSPGLSLETYEESQGW